MGSSVSSCVPSKIQNVPARAYFEKVLAINDSLAEDIKNEKDFKRLIMAIYDSLKKVPETETSFGMSVTGYSFGEKFLTHIYVPLKALPQQLTKVSLRQTGLTKSSVKALVNFILNEKNLVEIDLSQNSFDSSANPILAAVAVHPSLKSFIMEDCGSYEECTGSIVSLIKYNRKLDSLRLESSEFIGKNIQLISAALHDNRALQVATITQPLEQKISEITNRNKTIAEIVDGIAMSPMKRRFSSKMNLYKSIKGREMLAGRAKQKAEAKKTSPELFQKMDETDQRAHEIGSTEKATRTDRFRSGKAEMIGRRPNMEDVSVIVPSCPSEEGILYALFDGHGGREAAEFASEHLPEQIANRYKNTKDLTSSIQESFKYLQLDMKPWCVYVGCTACLVMIEGRKLTLANIGDTRAVLCRDGKAVQISVDHKPDLPEEEAYITSKGSFVREGRIGGQLAVSRAFGDGFLNDAVNSQPYINQIDLQDTDDFLIIACDGVWDVISNQDACDLIKSEIDPLSAATKLRDTAYEKESTDNISVIVVQLRETLVRETETQNAQ